MNNIEINSSKHYNYKIGKGILSSFMPDEKKILLLSDDKVFSLYGEYISALLKNGNKDLRVFLLPEKDEAKSKDVFCEIIKFAEDISLSKRDAVVSFGGGSISDVGGFFASVFERGIAHYIIPTTLLSMVDASVGGKNALNTRLGKNTLGTIYMPKEVISDTELLKSLSVKQLSCGMAEVIKYAAICDKSVSEDILSFNGNYDDIICKCVKAKAFIAEKDESDMSLRHILNFGHTLGHAFEFLGGGKLSHGEAISIGMINEAKMGIFLGITDNEVYDFLKIALSKFALPFKSPFTPDMIMKYIYADKKFEQNGIHLYLPSALGEHKEIILSDTEFENTLRSIYDN